MLRRSVSRTVAVLAAAAAIAVGTGAQAAVEAKSAAGPPYEYTTEIMHNNVLPLRRAAKITLTEHGYLYRAGGQDSHLVIRPVKFGLRFRDTGTSEFRGVPRSCRERRARVGVTAVCRIPAGYSKRWPMLIEVWPRLGDDFVDGSRLPATIAMTVLGDAGDDVARLGAGPDFFNGASGNDRVSGGAGNDWLRAGSGNDLARGGPGDDDVLGMGDDDVLGGGDGDDRLAGGPGNDRIYAGEGSDRVLCGDGDGDYARVDAADTLGLCEVWNLG